MKKHIQKGQERRVKVEANEMVDIDVHFISLVGRGANRVPFRIQKEDTTMLNLETIFKQEKPVQPKVVAVGIRKSDVMAGLVAAIEAMDGVEVTSKEEQDSGMLLMLDGATSLSEDVLTLKTGDDVVVLVENCKKSFDSWVEGSDFMENIKKAGFFPAMYVATDVMVDTISNSMYMAEKGEAPTSTVEEILKDYSEYMMRLVASVPATAFKFEKLEPVAVAKDEVGSGSGDAPAEEVAKSDDKVTNSVEAETETTEKEEDSTSVEKTEDVNSEVAAKSEAGSATPVDLEALKTMLESMVNPLQESIAGLTQKLEKAEQDTASVLARMDQVEQVAKSATEAVSGTVLGDSMGDAEHQKGKVTKSEANLWDSALSGLQL